MTVVTGVLPRCVTGTAHAATPRPVSVEELKRAWAALQAGQSAARAAPFGSLAAAARRTPPPAAADDDGARWTPEAGEQVLPVVGCAGSVGATTVSLAMAVVASTAARVVECCSATASGLAAASTAELGVHASGWRHGRCGEVLLERADGVRAGVGEIPLPTPPSHAPEPGHGQAALTVLDVGWELGQVLAEPSWLRHALREAPGVVAVTTATIPGVRRLEIAAELLGGSRVTAAVLGPPPRKWPRGVQATAGGNVRALLAAGRVLEVPPDRDLAVTGLSTALLPGRLLAAAAHILTATSTNLAAAGTD